MSKPYRGKNLWKLPAHGRATCPVCRRTRVKCLWTIEGVAEKVCKRCRKRRNM